MGKSRPHGMGGIYWSKSRDRWIGTYEAGWTTNGTRRRRMVTGRTKPEAQAKLLKAIREADQGTAHTAGTRPTIKAWADEWMSVREHSLRPASFQADSSTMANWIVPTLGRRRLDLLTPSDIRALHKTMRDAGLAESTIRRAHNTLHKMLMDAVREGYTVPEPARLVPGPSINTADRGALPLQDIHDILRVVMQRPDAARWVAALVYGTRPGEALGLTWDMIDFDEGEIIVAWQLQPLPYRDKRNRESGFRIPINYETVQVDGRLHLVRPKSRAGWRRYPLFPWMAEALLNWRAICPPSPAGLVWPAPDGRPQRDTEDRQTWYDICDQAQVAVTETATTGIGIKGKPTIWGRRPHLYECRHTAATILRANRTDDETITGMMGHASILSSKAYLHTDLTRKRNAVQNSADLLQLGMLPATITTPHATDKPNKKAKNKKKKDKKKAKKKQ